MKMKNDQENGFILLIAIGILMGLLAIMVATVRYTQNNTSNNEDTEINISSTSAKQSIKFASDYKNSLMGENEKSRLFRNWVFPTSKDLPIKLKLQSSFIKGSHKQVQVTDMRKLFFALATSRYNIYISSLATTQKPMMRLLKDIDAVQNNIEIVYDFVDTNNVSQTAPVTNIMELDGGYVAVGNELMAVADYVGSEFIINDRKTNRYGGVRSAHRAGEPVYAIRCLDGFPLFGYLKIEGDVFYVGVTQMYHDTSVVPTFTIYDYNDLPNLTDTTKSLTRSFSTVKTIAVGTVVEFYPFDPGFSNLEANWSVNYNLSVEDENGKWNLNTLTQYTAGNLFTQDAYITALKDVNLRLFPMKDINEILLISDYAASGADKNKIEQSYNQHKSNFTVFSKPNYFSNYQRVDDNTTVEKTNQAHFYWKDTMGLNLQHVQRREPSSPSVFQNDWANNTEDELILPHVINMNTASYEVIWRMLSKNFNGISLPKASAKDVAARIVRYRAGLNSSAGLAAGTYFTDVDYNGFVNPFDGVNDDPTLSGVRNHAAALEYSSAEDEFLAAIQLGLLTDTEFKEITNLVKRDVAHLIETQTVAFSEWSNFITFEASPVESHDFKYSISKDSQNLISEHKKVVLENFSTMDEGGYDIGDRKTIPSTDFHEGVVVLNSIHGWNENESILSGVTTYQPFLKYDDDGSGNVSVRQYNMKTDTYKKLDIYSSLYGRYNVAGASYRITGARSFSNSEYGLVFGLVENGAIPAFQTSADFGIHIIGEGYYDKVTLSGGWTAQFFSDNVKITGGNALISMPVASGVTMRRENGEEYVVHSIDDTLAPASYVLYLNPLPPGALQAELLKTSGTLIFSSATSVSNPTVYSFINPETVTPTGTPIAVTTVGNPAPYYETVIHRPGAEFTAIEWDDRSSLQSPGTNCTSLQIFDVDYGNDSGVQNPATNSYSINPLDERYDRLRLRFHFIGMSGTAGTLDNTSYGRQFPSPPLFEVRVRYKTRNEAKPPSNFVYSRE